jgi:hypothetical protein
MQTKYQTLAAKIRKDLILYKALSTGFALFKGQKIVKEREKKSVFGEYRKDESQSSVSDSKLPLQKCGKGAAQKRMKPAAQGGKPLRGLRHPARNTPKS